LRTGTARLQRGQASRLASIRSNAGFRCVGIALPTITTEANNGKVTGAVAVNTRLPKDCGNHTSPAQITGGSSFKRIVPARPKGGPDPSLAEVGPPEVRVVSPPRRS
jgi:hypothetical protein